MTDTLVGRFTRVAQQQREHTAITSRGGDLTYADLDHRSSDLARAMIASGVRSGDRVGLFFEREPNALVSMLAAWKSGAVAVPLQSSHPIDRLKQIADSAEARLVVAAGGTSSEAQLLGLPVLPVSQQASLDDSVTLPTLDPNDLALIIYTSGTTGPAKGLPQSHRLLIRKYQRAQQVMQISESDRVPLFSTFAMGQGITAIMLTLLSGATLCPFEIGQEGLSRLIAALTDERLTVWMSSATLLRNLTRTVDPERQFRSVRAARMGGERVLPSDVEAAQRVFPAARLFVTYATLETGQISANAIAPGDSYDNGLVPIGTPLDGIAVRILAEDGADVKPGGEGEIAVQSADIAEGYWRDPERSARVFAAVPGKADERLYRTGDLGRWRPDGRLEHLGRKDLRVKIRGFRVEIEEVEAAITQLADVVSAAVAAKPGADGDLRLVAYVQRVRDSDASIESIRAELALRLPQYMIPNTFMLLPELPLAGAGKVARQRLPDPPPERPPLGSTYAAPRNAREETIAAVWREVLGLHTVGIHDPFFSIGGDSLKATLIASRLSSRLGIEIPLVTLFEVSTIAELSEALDGLGSSPDDATSVTRSNGAADL